MYNWAKKKLVKFRKASPYTFFMVAAGINSPPFPQDGESGECSSLEDVASNASPKKRHTPSSNKSPSPRRKKRRAGVGRAQFRSAFHNAVFD